MRKYVIYEEILSCVTFAPDPLQRPCIFNSKSSALDSVISLATSWLERANFFKLSLYKNLRQSYLVYYVRFVLMHLPGKITYREIGMFTHSGRSQSDHCCSVHKISIRMNYIFENKNLKLIFKEK